MSEKLIENWNNSVRPNDDVYHLGDFAHNVSKGRIVKILCRLNGNKYIIAGNHDSLLIKRDKDFNIIIRENIIPYVKWIKDYHELTIQDKDVPRGRQLIVLGHYSMKVWNKSHWGSFNLFGHSHGTLSDDPNLLSIDVGVDAVARRYITNGILNINDYRPICYNEVKKIMASKKFIPVDHHKDRK